MTECRGEHIAVGTEILLGQIANTHARTVSLEFASQGFFIYHHHAVGDNLARVVEAFRQAAERSNVIVVTGGLGPTEDDLTREALAEFLHRPLDFSETAFAEIASYFQQRSRPMPAENRKQAFCVRGGTLLSNPRGTAPGQYVEDSGRHYFLLPGPPLEMVPMLQEQVLPRLRSLFPDCGVLVSRTLHFCGIGESSVDEQIPELLAGSNPTVAPLAGEGEMLLRITASDATADTAQERIAPIEASLRTRFGAYIYGADDDTLPSVVAQLLLRQGATLAAAESCTGGMVSSMMTSVPGVSSVFLGGVVAYDNAVKQNTLLVSPNTLQQYGAVSEQTAAEMAQGARRQLGSTYAISTTGIAGPGGEVPGKPVGLVYFAVAGPTGTSVFEERFRGSREQIRIRASKRILWHLWSELSVSNRKE